MTIREPIRLDDDGAWKARDWLFFGAVLLFSGCFFVGLFPGTLYPDTSAKVLNAIRDDFGAVWPPIIGYGLRIIFRFDPSLSTIFALQVGSYWLGVHLLLRALLRNRETPWWLALLLFLAAASPFCLNYQALLLKDVWLLSAYLVFFGVFALGIGKKQRLAYLLLMTVLALFIVLLRKKFFPIIPPLALAVCLIGFGPLDGKLRLPKLAQLAVGTLTLSLLLF
ncbi:MAG: hypothetical protein HRU51_07545, partial [Xanthomonadales bacterium]|nr:hypothetical protein [Xanthomonadales bacterium]